tara:strand:+ start:271 stop:999 length:729 start_codon:yes stop_codon:yes gene_type:complete
MQDENEVAIFMVTNDNFFETRYCIENLIQKTNVAFRLYILNFNTTDKEFISFLNHLPETVNCFVTHLTKTTMGETYNKMLDMVYQKYIVFMPYNALVNDNWIVDLIHSYNCIENSGCISIKSSTENLYLTSVLFKTIDKPKDEMRTVYANQTNTLKDFLFFGKDRLLKVGKISYVNDLNGLELSEFSFRFLGHGYINYYLKYQSCLRLRVEDELVFPTITETSKNKLKEQIEIMVNLEQYKK